MQEQQVSPVGGLARAARRLRKQGGHAAPRLSISPGMAPPPAAARKASRLMARPLALACALAWAPGAWACDANSTATLMSCLGNIAGDNIINLTSNITLTSNLNVVIGSSVTINGGGHTLDGGGQFRGFFVGAGSTTINDLTMKSLKAQGGAGGVELAGGGGGMGAGGAVFVQTGAALTINNVNLTGNSAAGGNGGGSNNSGAFVTGAGGGGMGGAGGGTGGGPESGNGGGGLFVNGATTTTDTGGNGGGPNGGAGGAPNVAGSSGGNYTGGGGAGFGSFGTPGGAGGLGGGGGGGDTSAGTGGAGGFGGGGGGGLPGAGGSGGTGGFGGGGGGGGLFGGGAGGFGGGAGAGGQSPTTGGGGGGAGMGGAIFVMDGASVTVTGTLSVNGNTVAGGAGGSSLGRTGGGGAAFGDGIFLQGNTAALTFSPSSGTQTVANGIADQNGSGGSGGSVGITKNGAGTTVLSGNNTYSGVTTINAGTLQVGAGGNSGTLGSGAVIDNGALTFNRGDTYTVANAISGTGVLNKTGTGTMILTGAVTLGGGGSPISAINVNSGTLRTGADNVLSANASLNVGATAVLDLDGHSQTVLGLGSGAGASITTGAASAILTLNNTGASLFGGVISGDGGVVIGGTGSQNFLGNNTYTGTTTVNAGSTLGLGFGTAAGSLGTGNVINNGGLNFARSDTVTVANNITGSGQVTVDGTAALTGKTIFTGNNGYTGTTTVTRGTLQVGDGGSSGTLGTGNVTLGATGVLDFNRGDQIVVANTIAGAGGVLSQSGAGITILTGNNTYTGGTVVNAGFLQVGNGGASGSIGAGPLTLNSGGTLLFNRSDDIAYAGAISGGGTLAKQGAGTLTLGGNNINYSGTTNISQGTLAFGNGSALGTGRVRVSGGAMLRSTASTALANELEFDPGGARVAAAAGTLLDLQGALVFTSGLLKFGSATDTGTVVLNSAGAPANVANASVEVAGGILRIGNANGAAVAAGASAFTVDSGASVELNDVATTIGNLQGAGLVNTGFNPATNLTVNSGSFAGAISGSGNLVKESAGTLVLSGSNTYQGATTINAGVLETGAVGTLPATTALTINGGTLRLDGNAQTVASLTGSSGTIDTSGAGGVLTTGGNNSSTSFGGVITGAGGLNKTGSGTLTLGGNSNYSGGTTVSAGTLQVNGGTGAGTGVINISGGAALGLNNTGAITNTLAGSGQLTVDGTVTLRNTTLSTYSGATTINSGALLFLGLNSNDGSLGSGTVLNNGQLQFYRNDDYIAANAISGGGTLTLEGAGTLKLTGNNSYTGDTTVASGVLQVGDGGATGTLGPGRIVLTNAGSLVFNRGGSVTAAGDIVDGLAAFHGVVSQIGSGTAILTGNNTYSGGTLISNGTLQMGNGASTGTVGTGDVTLSNNAALALDRSDSLALANNIGGAGSLTQMGGGTITLTGNNTYSGGTNVSGGVLQVGNGGTTGSLGTGNIALANGSGLAFNRSGTVTVADAISGNGTLTQMGSGNLVLSGASNYSGATNVTAGTLSVNGSITSAVTVGSGGILGGNGAVGSTTIMNGGVLAPGNSIGTITVNGNLNFSAGSIYRVETDAQGNADKTIVNGNLSMAGGTVDVQAGAGTYTRNTSYTILTATGGSTGAFTGATSNLAFLTPTLSYVGNNVLLNLQSSDVTSYTSVTGTGDQGSIANYLNGFANNPGNPGAAALIKSLDNLTAGQARTAFDSMTGSQYAAGSQISGALGRVFSDAVFGRAASAGGAEGGPFGALSGARYAALDASSFASPWGLRSDTPYQLAGASVPGIGSAPPANLPLYSGDTGVAASGGSAWAAASNTANTPGQGGLWAQALGSGGRMAGDGNGASSSYRAGGFIAGYDYTVSPQWLLGVSGGYTRTTWNASTNGIAPATGHIDSPMGALYARYSSGPWQLRINTTYADHDLSLTRSVAIGSATSNASSAHHGREWGVAAEVEYAIAAGGWQLRPLASLRYARLDEDAFTETGAGATNLTVASRGTQSTVLGAGARALYAFNHGNAGLALRAIASHTFGDVDSPISARLAGQPNSFIANGTPLKRDALTLGATLSAQIGKRLTGFVDVSAEERGSGQNAYALGAGLRYIW